MSISFALPPRRPGFRLECVLKAQFIVGADGRRLKPHGLFAEIRAPYNSKTGS